MSRKKRGKGKRPPRRKGSVSARPAAATPITRRATRRAPVAWAGETPADVAVFDENVRRELPAELGEQAVAVAEALQLVSEGRGEEANRRLAEVPRRSPLSDWRLLVRGLVDWDAGDREAAAATWSRLDPQRRPGRIARALQLSERPDLDALEPEASSEGARPEANSEGARPEASSEGARPEGSPEDPQPEGSSEGTRPTGSEVPKGDLPPLDRALLRSAKHVRQIRVERPALAEARRETARRESHKDVLLGLEKIRWLRLFATDYLRVEPELVAALRQEALRRAFHQPFVDVFDQAKTSFPGPPHDPRHSLLESRYREKFRDDRGRSEQLLQRYLTQELPANDQIPPALRDALISELYLAEAIAEVTPDEERSVFGRLARDEEDERHIAKQFQKATSAYPANREAHREYTDWIHGWLDDEGLEKSKQQTFEKRLLGAMQTWAEALPDDVEPHLWLVDHYLENEQLTEAKPHVQWLERSRQDDPRVRAVPWKWQLLEAMRLCRRKAWLDAVPERLDAAEAVWPAWLSRDWLPYLRAAWALRRGDTERYRLGREEIRQQWSAAGREFSELADAVMMLAAAQRMRVPAADLKPLRVPIDLAVKNLDDVSTDDLLAAGSFFWDLHRTAMLYPAYRMHGSKFAGELLYRLPAVDVSQLARRDEHQVLPNPQWLDGILWMSEHRFGDYIELRLPDVLWKLAQVEPKAAAAVVNAALKIRNSHSLSQTKPERKLLLSDAALATADAYYRFWFKSLVGKAEERLAKQPALGGLGAFGEDIARAFAQAFGGFAAGDDDEDWDDDEEDWDDEDLDDADLAFDLDCPCPSCTAARAAAGYPQPRSAGAASFAADPHGDLPFESGFAGLDLDFGGRPPGRGPRELPRDPEARRQRPKDPLGKKRQKGGKKGRR